jgi:hypothetical protein
MGDLEQRAWVSRVLGYEFHSDPGGGGGADFGVALARWRQAMADVRTDLARFRTALLADQDIRTDPRLRFVAAAASEIPNMLPAGGSRLEAAIIASVRASGDATAVLAAMADYRNALASAARLARLEDFARSDIKAPLAVRATLTQAMDDIERTLGRAA